MRMKSVKEGKGCRTGDEEQDNNFHNENKWEARTPSVTFRPLP